MRRLAFFWAASTFVAAAAAGGFYYAIALDDGAHSQAIYAPVVLAMSVVVAVITLFRETRRTRVRALPSENNDSRR